MENRPDENEIRDNVNNISEEKNDNNKKECLLNATWFRALIIVLICIVLLVVFGFAYAKYVTTKEGSATAEIANMICEMEVQASEANEEIINPYCIVTVKNYNANDEVTETSVNFKIEITPKEDFEIPGYYWEDENGTIVAQSTELTGSFSIDAKQTKQYKIVFLNTGEEDITKLVDFNLVAVQGIAD